MTTQRYATDLTDAEWDLIEPLLPAPAHTGRPRHHPWRTLLNAIFYQLRTGGAWRFLPQEWPPWQTVYHYFRLFRLDGTWERIHTTLRERLRGRLGRDPQPSAGSIDSQSVKTTGVGGVRGFDAGKHVKGRKRHLLVDTEGLVLKVAVHAADIMDRDGVKLLLSASIPAAFPRLRHIWLDAATTAKAKGRTGLNGRSAGRRRSSRIRVAHPKSGSLTTCPTTRLIGRSTCLHQDSVCCPGVG